MVRLNKKKSNMIDCMGKYYLIQVIFLVLYIKEHICVTKIISLHCKGRLLRGATPFSNFVFSAAVTRNYETYNYVHILKFRRAILRTLRSTVHDPC